MAFLISTIKLIWQQEQQEQLEQLEQLRRALHRQLEQLRRALRRQQEQLRRALRRQQEQELEQEPRLVQGEELALLFCRKRQESWKR
jgi:predicted phage tail protein